MRNLSRRGMAQGHRPRRHHLLPPVLRQRSGLRGAPDAPRQSLRACCSCCAGLVVSAARNWAPSDEATALLKATRLDAEKLYALQVVRIPEMACTRNCHPDLGGLPLCAPADQKRPSTGRKLFAVAGAWLSKLATPSAVLFGGPDKHQADAPIRSPGFGER